MVDNSARQDYCTRVNVRSSQSSRSNPLGERPTRILQATLDLVHEEGLTGFSIGKLGRRAQASPGIIYHYFENKDMLIHTLYREVLAQLVHAITEDIYTLSPLERLKALWLNTFEFHVQHPQETVFLEQYKNSAYYRERLPDADAPLERLSQMFEVDIESGIFKALPLPVLQAMTFEVAVNLAKLHVAGRLELDRATLDTVANTVCRAALR